VKQLYEWAKGPKEVSIAGMRVLGEARTRRLVVHEAEEHHSRSHPRLLHQVQLGLHTSRNDISGTFRTIREMIVSVHTGVFIAMYPSEC
jgi:hypothetical protein